MLSISLKGHGTEADFLGLLQKLVPHESRTLPFEPFWFWLRIRGDIRIRKTTPRYHWYGESPNSAHQWYGESPTSRITDHCVRNWCVHWAYTTPRITDHCVRNWCVHWAYTTSRITDHCVRNWWVHWAYTPGTNAFTERSPFKTFRAYTSGTDAYPEHTGQELMRALHIHVRNLCLAPPKIKVISYIWAQRSPTQKGFMV
jgi:hypothetical protein